LVTLDNVAKGRRKLIKMNFSSRLRHLLYRTTDKEINNIKDVILTLSSTEPETRCFTVLILKKVKLCVLVTFKLKQSTIAS